MLVNRYKAVWGRGDAAALFEGALGPSTVHYPLNTPPPPPPPPLRGLEGGLSGGRFVDCGLR